jgi:phenylpropionate dioxygenase-like ring-hydroxylating dioxygenase large terminal subunit
MNPEVFATRNWYVAGRSSELTNRPLGRLVCGRDIALFRDAAGRPQAIDATCPHRGANLARGEVTGDSLACPFHGIAYDGTGRCTRIPSQAPTAPIPKALRVASYPVRESAGLLWIWPDSDSEPADAPLVPDFMDLPAPWRSQTCAATLCTGSYLNSLENALDDAHLGFIHRRTLPGAPPEIAPYRVTIAPDRRSYRGAAEFDPATAPRPTTEDHPTGVASGSALLDLLARYAMDQLVTVRREFRYELSGLVCYCVDYVGGKRDYAYAFFTPADAERTWMIPGTVRNHSLNTIADRLFERFMPALIAEDSGAMTLLTPQARGPGGLGRPFVVRADRTSFPFRRLYGEQLHREGKPVPWALDSASTMDSDSDLTAIAS